MGNLKTLWQLLQEVVEKEDRYFSLYDFLEEENRYVRRDIKEKLEEADNKQFYEYMDWFEFVNKTEVYLAVCEYYEKTMDRSISMWECGDMSEVADDYIREKNLKFDDEDEENILPF